MVTVDYFKHNCVKSRKVKLGNLWHMAQNATQYYLKQTKCVLITAEKKKKY